MASFKILISVGRENPMGMSATPSQGEEKIHESRQQKENPAESQTVASSPSSVASKQPPFSPSLCFSASLLSVAALGLLLINSN